MQNGFHWGSRMNPLVYCGCKMNGFHLSSCHGSLVGNPRENVCLIQRDTRTLQLHSIVRTQLAGNHVWVEVSHRIWCNLTSKGPATYSWNHGSSGFHSSVVPQFHVSTHRFVMSYLFTQGCEGYCWAEPCVFQPLGILVPCATSISDSVANPVLRIQVHGLLGPSTSSLLNPENSFRNPNPIWGILLGRPLM